MKISGISEKSNEVKKMEYTEIQDMLDFIAASPTSFQAVEQLKARLAEAGYEEQVESAAWTLTPGGRYFTIRNHSSLLAWQSRKRWTS